MNPNGNAANLLPAEPGNERAVKHGVYAADRRTLEPAARQIADRLLEAPHTVELDELGAIEIGRLEALIRAIDADLATRGLTTKRGEVRSLVDIRLRASRRLSEWLREFGCTPKARFDFASRMATGSVADEIQRRLAAIDQEERDRDEHS